MHLMWVSVTLIIQLAHCRTHLLIFSLTRVSVKNFPACDMCVSNLKYVSCVVTKGHCNLPCFVVEIISLRKHNAVIKCMFLCGFRKFKCQLGSYVKNLFCIKKYRKITFENLKIAFYFSICFCDFEWFFWYSLLSKQNTSWVQFLK